MQMAALNNNEKSFELLRGSLDSNSGSDGSEIVFPVKKKRFRRRLKNNPSIRHEELGNECQCKLRTIGLTLFCLVVICWLVILSWLTLVLHGELSRLTSHLSKVVAGNQGVPDALQKCHSLSKELQKNQTLIVSRLTGFSVLLDNFSAEMIEIKSGLQTVQDQLKSSPDLVSIPRLIHDLPASVASFGSQIRDLNSTVTTLKDQNGKMDAIVGNLVTNLKETNSKLMELSKGGSGVGSGDSLPEKTLTEEKKAILAIVSQVSKNVSVINETVSNKLQWTADDQFKDHKLIESLREMNENITARVKTLEGLCAKETNLKFSTVNSTSDRTNILHPENSRKQKPIPLTNYSGSSSTGGTATDPKNSGGLKELESKTNRN